MSRAFHASNGRVSARLDRYEVAVLRGLVTDVVGLLDAGAPDNAVTRRLFPDPSFDPAEASSLRELIQDDLREAKLDAARTMLESLPEDGRVSLDVETAELWLTALNDVRLALGTALGITEESYGEEPDEADAGMHAYQWVSFLQETLVDAVSAFGFQR